MKVTTETRQLLKELLIPVTNPQTMLIGENWYYWNEKRQEWMPEYKFEETK